MLLTEKDVPRTELASARVGRMTLENAIEDL
jgi:hypothetical protein